MQFFKIEGEVKFATDCSSAPKAVVVNSRFPRFLNGRQLVDIRYKRPVRKWNGVKNQFAKDFKRIPVYLLRGLTSFERQTQ